MHQTVSLIGTSHMVSGYYTFWQGSEKNATGEGKQYWPTEKQNIPFRIPWKLLTSSRHFLRSSTAFSREIAEREHGSQVLKALTLSKTLPQLWAELLTFSGQHDTQTDTAKKKKKKSQGFWCTTNFLYMQLSVPGPALRQPQAIANWFATEKGKRDGICLPWPVLASREVQWPASSL